MCSDAVTDLKIEAVNKLIALGEIEVEKLHLLKRGISLHARLCAARTETPDNIVEHARLQRNEVHNHLDEANLDLDAARLRTELVEIMDAIEAQMTRETSGGLLGSLLSFLGGLGDDIDIDARGGFGFPLGDDIDSGFGPFGGRDHEDGRPDVGGFGFPRVAVVGGDLGLFLRESAAGFGR